MTVRERAALLEYVAGALVVVLAVLVATVIVPALLGAAA